MKRTICILFLAIASLSSFGQHGSLKSAVDSMMPVYETYKAAIFTNFGAKLSKAESYRIAATMEILDSNGMLNFSQGFVLTKKSQRRVLKMTDNNFVDGTTIDYSSLQYMITNNKIRLDKYANPTQESAEFINLVIEYKHALADAQLRFRQHQYTGRKLKCIRPRDLKPPVRRVEDTLIDGIRYFRILSWKGSVNYFQTVDSVHHLRTYSSDWNHPLFVTVAPQLSNWFWDNESTMKNVGEFKVRLAQLLGMPPGTDYGYMVGLWVRYEDLFRPTFDSSIEHVVYKQDLTKATTHPEYLKWLNNYFVNSYNASTLFGDYPFTGLGYTYDSSPENFSHIGMSEFITNGNTKQYISFIYRTEEFYDRLVEGL
jgi:hypothetical protein